MVPVAVKTVPDYYPFGGVIADRGFGRAVQPHKTAGKELDMMHGLGWADFGARRYDPVLPQWTQPDPLAEKYYHLSPYSYCGLNPANNIDPDGRKITYYIDDEEYKYTVKDGHWGFYADKRSILKGRNAVLDGLEGIRTANAIGEKMINDLVNSDQKIVVNQINADDKNKDNRFNISDDGNLNVFWNPYEPHGGVGISDNGIYTRYRDPFCGLAHELGHTYDEIMKNQIFFPNGNIKDYIKSLHRNVLNGELIPCIVENSMRESYGDPIRLSYKLHEGSNGNTINRETLLNYTPMDRLLLLMIKF